MDIAKKLKQAAGSIKKARPFYEPIIDFYWQVFLAQEQSKDKVTLPEIQIEPELLNTKLKNEIPLIDQPDNQHGDHHDRLSFLIDIPEAARLFEHLCDLAYKFAPQLSSNALLLKKAAHNKTLNLQKLIPAIP